MAYNVNRKKVTSQLLFEGANGSTTHIDQKGLIWTPVNGAALSNGRSKFGATSLYLVSSARQAISTPFNAAIDLLGGEFTIAGWVYCQSINGTGSRIYSTGGGSVAWNATNGIHILLQASSTDSLNLNLATGTATPISVAITGLTPGTWKFITASVKSGFIYLGVDGVVTAFSIGSISRPSGNPSAQIGEIPGESSTTFAFNGNIDSMEVTKGIALYTANFTPPTSPFSLEGVTISGVTENGDPPSPVSRKIVLVRASDQIVVGSGISSAVDGSYSITTSVLPAGADAGEVILGMAYPDYGLPPLRSTAYVLDAKTWVGSPAPLGHWYQSEQAGTTGSSAPTWPTNGSTVTDGTVIWRDKGVMERPWAEGPFIAPST